MRVRVGTFNVENLFARFRFRSDFSLPNGEPGIWTIDNTKFAPFSDKHHRITAQALGAIRADILGLQEIENLTTLRRFLRQFKHFMPNGGYPYQILIDGNDPRLIDVALISQYPLGAIHTHQFELAPNGNPIFSRDCLEVKVRLPNGKPLTVFVNHFKSMMRDRQETMATRRIQAIRVAEILQERFGPDPGQANWVVVGDLNDYLPSEGLEPLLEQPWLENVMNRLPPDDRWTHYFARGNKYNQLDYVLVSRAIAQANPDARPEIERRGLPQRARRFQERRFGGVGLNQPKASDHCPVGIELEI